MHNFYISRHMQTEPFPLPQLKLNRQLANCSNVDQDILRIGLYGLELKVAQTGNGEVQI